MGALYSYTTEVEEQQEQQEQQSRGGKRFVLLATTSCTLECVEERKMCVCERERERSVCCARRVCGANLLWARRLRVCDSARERLTARREARAAHTSSGEVDGAARTRRVTQLQLNMSYESCGAMLMVYHARAKQNLVDANIFLAYGT